MLIFRLKRMFALRGIDKPHKTLVKAGISPSTATQLLNYHRENLNIEHLAKLCVLLNCTPNDLFEWRASDKQPISETHALNSLQRTEKPLQPLSEIIKDIPVEKLSQIADLLHGLKEQDL